MSGLLIGAFIRPGTVLLSTLGWTLACLIVHHIATRNEKRTR